MNIINNIDDINNLIKTNDLVLLYFSGTNCGVCEMIKPRIIKLLDKYPKIKSIEIETEKNVLVSAQFNIFTFPSVLLFIDSKEVLRKLRYMSIDEIDSIISRYYNLYY